MENVGNLSSLITLNRIIISSTYLSLAEATFEFILIADCKILLVFVKLGLPTGFVEKCDVNYIFI